MTTHFSSVAVAPFSRRKWLAATAGLFLGLATVGGAKAQETIDVLDVSSLEARASDACQRRYDDALARVDSVLREAPSDVHPRRLAEAIRRQAVAARACRPISPEVEDVVVDDPSTWPHDATRAVQPWIAHSVT